MATHVGQGAYGTVYPSRHAPDRVYKATSMIHEWSSGPNKAPEPQIDSTSLMESTVATLCMHAGVPGVIQYTDVAWARGYLELEIHMKRAQSSLYAAMTKDSLPNWPKMNRVIPKIFDQLLVALYHLHKAGVAHCDLKPQNVLVMDSREESFTVKIADFGSARLHRFSRTRASANMKHHPVCGTFQFLAPECFKDDPDEKLLDLTKVDAYALGMTIYFCVFRELPICISPSVESTMAMFHAFKAVHQGKNLTMHDLPVDIRGDEAFRDLVDAYDGVKRLLHHDPAQRASIEDLYVKRRLSQIASPLISVEDTTPDPELMSLKDAHVWASERAKVNVANVLEKHINLVPLGRFHKRDHDALRDSIRALSTSILTRFVMARGRRCFEPKIAICVQLAASLILNKDACILVDDISIVREITKTLGFRLYK